MDAVWEYFQRWQPDPEALVGQVARWAARNSWSRNAPGVAALAEEVRADFAALGGMAELRALSAWREAGPGVEPVPLGPALHVVKRPEAPLRVLLVAHLDTVFPPEHPFRDVAREGGALAGPGVADCKGGVAVLRAALEALEGSPWAGGLGWEVWLTPDEEVGSPGSSALLQEAAGRCHVGLVFEPGFADGALVAGRKGTGNYAAVVRGRSAHAGRNPEEGRNAIHALASFVTELAGLDGAGDGITVNVGRVEGGGPVNVVPDRATAWFNVRLASSADQLLFQAHLERTCGSLSRRDGIRLELQGGVARAPWRPDERSRWLLDALGACSQRLGGELGWRASGGASDANLLAAAGLPVADGLGPWSQGTHTDRERIDVASLGERARLAGLLLLGLASGEISVGSATARSGRGGGPSPGDNPS